VEKSNNKTTQFQFKEYQLTLATQANDMLHKIKNAVKYLHHKKKKYKARLVIRLRGRHQNNAELVPAQFEKFIALSEGMLAQEGPISHKPGSDTWLIILSKPKERKD
jgi:translation initiation factor IF-3